MNRTQKDLNELLVKAIKQVEEQGIPVNSEVIEDNIAITRATKTFGRCQEVGGGVYSIGISKYYKDNQEEEIMETLVHEVLHTVPGCFNHGKAWKKYAGIMNEAKGYNIGRTSNRQMDNLMKEEVFNSVFKYSIDCEKCGSSTLRQRRSKIVKNPENYICKCGGTLTSRVL